MTQRLGHFFLVVIFAGMIAGIIGQWHYSVGFDPADPAWWQWLGKAVVHPAGIPSEMLNPAIMIATGCGLLFCLVSFLMSRARNDTVSGSRKAHELHGSARWATIKDIKKARLFRKPGDSVVIGAWRTATGKIRALRYKGPEHILVWAATRTGKGVALIIATLLTWTKSSLVLDIKGENYTKTAGWLKFIGHRVEKFEPAAISGSSRFNPLAEVRIGTERDIADCQNIAAMIIDPDGKGMHDYWRQEGYGWLSVVLLHVLYKTKQEENRIACFDDVNSFLSGISTVKPPADALESAQDGASGQAPEDQMDAQDNFVKILEGMAEYDHGVSHVNKEVRRGANSLAIKAPQERSGVHSNAKTQLTIFADPIIARNTAVSDFRIKDLMNGDRPMALYLVVSPADKDRMRPLIRIFLNLFLRRQTESLEAGYKYELLMMLDELAALGKMEILEESLSFMAGYGIRAFMVFQNVEQLHKCYGKDESLMANSKVRIAFTPNKLETAKLVSDMTGKATIVQKRRSQSGKSGQLSGSNSDNIHETSRPLLTPDECMRLPVIDTEGKKARPGDALIFVAGAPPIHGTQSLYFLDKELNRRSQMPPPVSSITSNDPSEQSEQEKTHVAA
jgi:type IV secretion system protein VirD4